MKHHVKSRADFFIKVVTGEETAQIRKDDRNYQPGDQMILYEWISDKRIFSGKTCSVSILSVIRDFTGLQKGYCCLSIKFHPWSSVYRREIAGKRKIKFEKEEKVKVPPVFEPKVEA